MRQYPPSSTTSIVLRWLRRVAAGALLLAAVVVTCAPQTDGVNLIVGSFGLRIATETGRLKMVFVAVKTGNLQQIDTLPPSSRLLGTDLRVTAPQIRYRVGWTPLDRRRTWEDLWYDTFDMSLPRRCILRFIFVPGWFLAMPSIALLLYGKFAGPRHATGGFEVNVQAKPVA